ncbi:hypothetical protein [Aliamphritea hakodatensis]|uniref:hypothetical protein n=1 Tax=Aliamphritea hakodatensis TaxID=2895352 RepID=UPI0022FDA283|nr:hypothetical protein [Aliamphritea hakodatensis]
MKGFQQIISGILIVALITGCAATSTQVISDGDNLSDAKLCRNYLNDYQNLLNKRNQQEINHEEFVYLQALILQVQKRDLTPEKCSELVKDQNIAAIGVGALLIITAALIAAGGGRSGSGSGSSKNAAYSDQGFAWDQFYDLNGDLTWRCRNKANGQFAYDSDCILEPKSDFTWPGK